MRRHLLYAVHALRTALRTWAVCATVLLLSCCLNVTGLAATANAAPAALAAGTARPAAGTDQADVPAPPMGWASWNSFAAKINYSVIKGQADAMVSHGRGRGTIRQHRRGLVAGNARRPGNITVDTAEWPGGMQAIADYIHGNGLKAGIYTDAGKNGCGYYYPTGRPAAPGSGSEGHYDQDFLQFSKWGFDFVKVDWCGGEAEGLDPQTAYQAISDSTQESHRATGRPSCCRSATGAS